MVKYVTDLLKAAPEEILHLESGEVQAIVHCPKAESNRTVLVVFKNGGFASYTQAGEGYVGGSCRFIYKPRTKRVLKPLHQILAENPYYIGTRGIIYFDDDVDIAIDTTEMQLFTGTAAIPGWPDSFYTEIGDDTSTANASEG